jgi:hypothetical protein
MFRGQVVAIYTAPEKGAPMERHDEVEAVAGVGLDGDRYATGDGKYTRSSDGGERAVTLIEREAVEAARREYDSEPCVYLEGLTRSGVREALVHRAGLRAEILAGGTMQVGDRVEPDGAVS